MSELGGKHRPVQYGRRAWRKQRARAVSDLNVPWLRVGVAFVTALALLAPLLAYRQARQELGEADRRITALEWEQKRAHGDNDRLKALVGDLEGRLAWQGAGGGPLPGETTYEAPTFERTMPPAQPNRSRPRRTLTPTPMPHPSWRPATPSPGRPAGQPSSPTPSPTESPTCPAATVGENLHCVLESLPVSESPSVP